MKKLMMMFVAALAAGVAQAEPVSYRDYDANTGAFTNAVRECTPVTSDTRTRYAGWFGLCVALKGEEWVVEVVLTDTSKSNLAETAAMATRRGSSGSGWARRRGSEP